uniref:Uncharacterized protein MANES_11G016600 n=1 Tax=Rhizophora mucronata TaxID=61149 RepID=A0A2P2JN86_RHIMU
MQRTISSERDSQMPSIERQNSNSS